ncbi:MAG: Transcriptional regulator, contains XRE-family domain [Frankiales bacterium]|nr:Transcriptional regulator, contains XRE-family domain [Frankiales bacterium]
MTQQNAPIAFTLGDRLRKARVRSGLDQQELADRIAASRNTVSNYENGHHGKRGPKVMVLRAWAHECGVTYEDLMAPDTSRGTRPDTLRYRPPALAA